MSLSISLVRRCDDKIVLEKYVQGDFVAVNKVLQMHGLPPHTEPPASSVQGVDLPEVAWPTSAIHHLRYLAARWIEDPTWTPDISIQQKYKIPVRLRNAIYQERQSHLVCHSDFDGYYLPIDFRTVIFDQTIGGWLGSSNALQKELKELAEKLNFDLGEYTPDLYKLSKAKKPELKNEFLGEQKWLLLCLYNIATASIRYGSAICFT